MGKNETKRRNQHTRDREERMPKKQKTKEHVESAQRKLQNLLGSDSFFSRLNRAMTITLERALLSTAKK